MTRECPECGHSLKLLKFANETARKQTCPDCGWRKETTMTYRAFWQDDHSKILFRGVAAEQVRKRLGACRVAVDKRNTIGRLDGGDEYEFAMFEREGRIIMVIAETGPSKKRDE